MIMFEALFLYHLPQASNYILAFSFSLARDYVQNESMLTSYQKQTVGMWTIGLKILMKLK